MNKFAIHLLIALASIHSAYCNVQTSPYQPGTYISLSHKNGVYAMHPVQPCCTLKTADLYQIEQCQHITTADGTPAQKITAVQEKSLFWGIPLYKKIVTITQTDASSLKSGPGGPEVIEQMYPHAQGMVGVAILALGLGGIFYKMIKKIKELENTRIA